VSGAPDPKSRTLARGERRYRRKVASPKQWQAIIAAKRGNCRVCGYGVPAELTEFHHLVSRAQGGDDVEDNIVPLGQVCHDRVTRREPDALAALAASLADAEYAYVVGKLGEGGPERLFGVGVSR
jgi:5-methylcytosine-specific restriction endonuclease McrA